MRYFIPEIDYVEDFVEVTVKDLVSSNFEKINSWTLVLAPCALT
jgi:hypothetical protein